jgi:hypothetical protein
VTRASVCKSPNRRRTKPTARAPLGQVPARSDLADVLAPRNAVIGRRFKFTIGPRARRIAGLVEEDLPYVPW